MKKVFLFLFSIFSFLLVSCDKDDDDSNGGNDSYKSMVSNWIKEDVNHDSLTTKMFSFLTTQKATTPIFDNTNPQAVTQGYAKCPTFTINSPMLLFCVWTYHWNYINSDHSDEMVYSWVEDSNGKAYGKDAPTEWQYGQGRKEKANWLSFPVVEIPAGTYTVKCSSMDTWSHNSSSNDYGFCWIYGFAIETSNPKGSSSAKDSFTLLDISGEGEEPMTVEYKVTFNGNTSEQLIVTSKYATEEVAISAEKSIITDESGSYAANGYIRHERNGKSLTIYYKNTYYTKENVNKIFRSFRRNYITMHLLDENDSEPNIIWE